jgi:signal transduction histidine kinase/Tfp pilus assembly protein PilF
LFKYIFMRLVFRFVLLFLVQFALVLCVTNVLCAQQKKDLQTLQQSLNQALPDSLLLRNYNDIIEYYNDRDNDSAVFYGNLGLNVFQARDYKVGVARMLLNLGNFSDTHGNIKAANEKITQALAIFSAVKDRRGYADAANNYGALLGKKGDYDKALRFFLEALKIQDSLGNKKRVFAALLNVGLVCDYNRDTIKALEYYKRAEELSANLPLSENTLIVYNNIGSYYFDRKDTMNAFRYLRKLLDLSDKPEFIKLHIFSMLNYGETKWTFGATAEGEYYLLQALALTRKHTMPEQEATALLNIARHYLGSKPDTAYAYLNKAYNLVRASGNKPKELEALNALTEFYVYKKDYEQAIGYMRKQHALSDSLTNIDKAKEIAHLTAVYELEKSNEKVTELETLVSRIRIQKVIIIIIGALMFVFFFVLLHFYRITLRLNVSLGKNRDKLVKLNNMKDKLFSVMGHDLRGPIGNIPVILEMVEEVPELPEEYKDLLRTLKEHTMVTTETLDNLLLLGKSVMNGINYIPTNFNPKSNILKNVDLLTLTARKKDIELLFKVPDDLSVHADPGHFDFILRNLISNAIKYSYNNSRVEITAKRNEDAANVLFSVSDKGTGMSVTVQKNIFKTIVTSSFGTANEKGNGIGLKLCEEFVRMNGGEIWVDSKEGEGATFCFTLPYFD